ncbi:MAG: RDD family protein [Anaerolineales bacterium]
MSIQEETLDINTPENVAFGYQVAGIGSRFLATLIDTILVTLLQVIVFVTYYFIVYALDIDPMGSGSAWVAAVMGLVIFLFYWGYYIFFEMFWNGQTPGKRWTGLRVIRNDGTPITLSESAIRNLTRIVDFLPAAYGVGIITMFIDKRSRRLGDLAAGTLVVHDRAPISIQSIAMKRSANLRMHGTTRITLDGFPIERISNDELNLIEEFLLRRDQLTHHETLAIQILNTLHTRLGLPLPMVSRLEAEDTLVAIMQAVQKNLEEKQS